MRNNRITWVTLKLIVHVGSKIKLGKNFGGSLSCNNIVVLGQRIQMMVVHSENEICIEFSKNLVFHDSSKHIDSGYHFITDCLKNKIVQLQYIPTDEQVENILMKSLGKGKIILFRDKFWVM